MNFALDEDSVLFAETFREILERFCTPDAVRASWDDASGAVNGLWEKLADTGVLGLVVPQDYGGLGLGQLDQVLMLEELGRTACPEPIAEHSAVAVPLLRDRASTAVQEEWLSRAADGSALLTAGSPAGNPSQPLVLAAERADLVVLAIDNALHVVPAAALSTVAQVSVDGSRRLARVEATTSSETLVSKDPLAVVALWDHGAWAAAAQAIGVAQQLLDLTVAYVSEREQFGQPVGVNQAVKHHCSNLAIAIEFARPMVHAAAWSLTTGRAPEGTVPPEAIDSGPSVVVSMAKALASDAVDLACRSALQCHGAIGYTIEHDLQLWLKRGWALSASWGDARHHRRRVANGLGLVQA
ncbi:MAG: acyl-CoA/acyl-ACP dehydrogenase [Acidimicrobiales bacterium]|nr:acyl-CoA/acyl-ACP dehydrogenase [Acidimicrobiales bacterium]